MSPGAQSELRGVPQEQSCVTPAGGGQEITVLTSRNSSEPFCAAKNKTTAPLRFSRGAGMWSHHSRALSLWDIPFLIIGTCTPSPPLFLSGRGSVHQLCKQPSALGATREGSAEPCPHQLPPLRGDTELSPAPGAGAAQRSQAGTCGCTSHFIHEFCCICHSRSSCKYLS